MVCEEQNAGAVRWRCRIIELLATAKAKAKTSEIPTEAREVHDSKISNKTKFQIFVAQVKLQRAYGGCLGTDSR